MFMTASVKVFTPADVIGLTGLLQMIDKQDQTSIGNGINNVLGSNLTNIVMVLNRI